MIGPFFVASQELPSCPGGESRSSNSPPGQEGWQPLWADGVVEMFGIEHPRGYVSFVHVFACVPNFLFVVPNPLNHPARSGHPSWTGGVQPLWADGVVEMVGIVHFELYEVSRRRFASQTFAVSVLVCGT